MLFVVLMFLTINKQLDLQSALTALARCMAKVQGWDADPGRVGWGDWETALELIERPLKESPYLLGEHFSAADILVGGALGWLRHFGVMPKDSPFDAYIDRLHDRPAYHRMQDANH